MEDAHIAKLDFMDDPDMHLFGVFDGHGGFIKNYFFYLNFFEKAKK